ncbi:MULTISPECIES: cold shock domain-containing protein [Enterobacterales]|jgi:CspA family cold shock protein|nr:MULTISPECIES: cold shock domain-containing protein [Enterobacterales]EHO1684616.1 cold shock domain-containing protein [Salmonella enterica]ELI8051720.1 cold shock domain-containing protein [Yersinia enterocolitica]ELZ5052536.1 cold shock domain-containing protein [Enterobacter asburiae]GKW44269.1 cold-shock protein [Pectobacterium carotovorum subsp. carotovorum]HBL7242181.1 cold shock domain-containing protein [Serratia liquefaciens]
MDHGFVNFFDSVKGYGFIRREQGRDVMFRSDDIPNENYTVDIPKGTKVQFNTVKTAKGLKAIDILFI